MHVFLNCFSFHFIYINIIVRGIVRRIVKSRELMNFSYFKQFLLLLILYAYKHTYSCCTVFKRIFFNLNIAQRSLTRFRF